MNLNEYVWVRLNEHGEEIFRAYHAGLGLDPAVYRPIIDSGGGWCRLQAWELMRIFGPHMANGSFCAFDSMDVHTERPEGAER